MANNAKTKTPKTPKTPATTTGYPTKSSAPKSKLVRTIDRKLTNSPAIIESVKDGTIEGVDSDGVVYTKEVCKFKFAFPALADKHFDYVAELEVRGSVKRIVDEFTLVDLYDQPRVAATSFEAKHIILAITDYKVEAKGQVARYSSLADFYNAEKPVLKGSYQKLYAIFVQQDTEFEYILNPNEFAKNLTGRDINISTYLDKGRAFVTSPAYVKQERTNKGVETATRKSARGLWS
tara:strand:- start:108 stop:812 length:705 start_codon:yes stop_codon:yes gene_type:complete